MVLPSYILLIHNYMSFITKFSIVLIALWILFALTWSSWLWVIIILFPIITLSQVTWKWDIWTLVVWVIFLTIIGWSFIDEGIISIWDVIVYIYIFVGLFVLWKIFWKRSNNSTDEASPYMVSIFFVSIIWTIWISIWIPNPKPIWTIVPTSTGIVIPVSNTSSITVTDTWILINSGISK